MKAKYRHQGNDCIIYDQVICEDNIVVTVRSYRGAWGKVEPKTTTEVCLTNSEAKRKFFNYCHHLEGLSYECVYKEVYK